MANTSGEKELKREWPLTSGLIAQTTKQEGRSSYLVAQKGSKVLTRNLAGIR